MNIASKDLSADDPSNKFINFTEDFRRAKRNSLTWSAITSFIAFAPTWDENTTILGMKVAYPQAGLAFLLWMVAVFFVLSFIRSYAPVRAMNSEAAAEAQAIWTDIKETLQGWRDRLRKPEEAINNLHSISESIRDKRDEARNHFGDIPTIWNELYHKKFAEQHDNFQNASKYSGETDPKALEREFTRWRQTTSKVGSLLGQEVSDRLSSYSRKLDEIEDLESKAFVNASEDVATSIEQLERSLSEFRDAISENQRNWFYTLDLGAIFAAFFFATFGTLTRAFVPRELNGAIVAIFG